MAFISRNNIDKRFINIIEENFSFSLPNHYIDFLVKYGEINITFPNYVEFKVDYLEDSSVSIESILGNNIIEVNREFLDEIEDYIDAIIIGSDPGGNFFLLEKTTDHILYWDRTWLHDYIGQSYDYDVISYKNEDDNEDNSPSIFLLFNSFAELETEIFRSIEMQKSKIIEEDT